MRIVLDMDQVLCDLTGRLLEWYNEDFGTSYTIDDITDWDMSRCLPNFKHFFRSCLRYPETFRDLEPLPGAIEGVKSLVMDGHDVIIATVVSSFAGIAYHGKLEWMRRNIGKEIFDLDNFVSIKRKYLLDADVIVDDGVHNVLPWIESSRHAIVFRAPWNRTFTVDCVGSDMARFFHEADDWRGVLSIVAGLVSNR